jgi:glycerophosphoryl diester phosphodiesterase
VIICGHRGGAKGIHLDNTLGAFNYAIDIGLDMIEFDVWLTADNKIIVTHGGDNGEMNFEHDAMHTTN